MDSKEFARKVYAIVAQIPEGKVSTYGEIALLSGYPKNARHVGKSLKFAPEGLPCHRVVNAQGRTVPGWTQQRVLLEKEGVLFLEKGRVNLKKCRWL
jgi:methylated-DNA-protein-cysteine methyltransferase-like protein